MSLALVLTIQCSSKAGPQSMHQKTKKLMAFK